MAAQIKEETKSEYFGQNPVLLYIPKCQFSSCFTAIFSIYMQFVILFHVRYSHISVLSHESVLAKKLHNRDGEEEEEEGVPCMCSSSSLAVRAFIQGARDPDFLVLLPQSRFEFASLYLPGDLIATPQVRHYPVPFLRLGQPRAGCT